MKIQKDMNRYKFQMGAELPPEMMQQMQGMPTEQGIPMEQGMPVEQGNGEASFAQQLMFIEQEIDKIQKEMKKLEKRGDRVSQNEYKRLEQQLMQLEQQKEMLRQQVEATRRQLETQEQMQGEEYLDPNAQYEMSPEELDALEGQYQDVPMEEQINPEEMQMMQYGGKIQTGKKILNWLGQIPVSETIGGQISENTMKNLDKNVSEGKISYDEYKNRLNMAIAETLKGNATGAFLSGTAFAGPIVEQISPVISFADKATTGFLGSSGLWSQIPILLLDNWSNNSYRNIYGKDNPASYTVTKREMEERKKQANSTKKSFGGKMQAGNTRYGYRSEDYINPIPSAQGTILNLNGRLYDSANRSEKNKFFNDLANYRLNNPENIPQSPQITGSSEEELRQMSNPQIFKNTKIQPSQFNMGFNVLSNPEMLGYEYDNKESISGLENNTNIDYNADKFLNYDKLGEYYPSKSKEWLKSYMYSFDDVYKNSPKNIPLDEALARASLNALSQEDYEKLVSFKGLDRFKNDREGLIRYAQTGEPGNAYDLLNRLIIRNQNTARPYPYHTDEEREQLLAEEPKLSLEGLDFTPKRVANSLLGQRPSGIDNADQRLHDAITQKDKEYRRDLRRTKIQSVKDYFGDRPLSDYANLAIAAAGVLDNRARLNNELAANMYLTDNEYPRLMNSINEYSEGVKQAINREHTQRSNRLRNDIRRAESSVQPRSVFGRSANLMAMQDTYNENQNKLDADYQAKLAANEADRSKQYNAAFENFAEIERANKIYNINKSTNALEKDDKITANKYNLTQTELNRWGQIEQDRRDRNFLETQYLDNLYNNYYVNLLSAGIPNNKAIDIVDKLRQKNTKKSTKKSK